MHDQFAPEPQILLDQLETRSTRHETPCGDGKMVWRMWAEAGEAAPVVALFHGGAGSWRHWVHTIPALASRYRVLVPDLPGLGESAFPPDGEDANAIAAIVAEGIDQIIGAQTPYAVVGFSFGATMAACVGAQRGSRVRSVTLIGCSGITPAGGGQLGSGTQLLKVRKLEGEERREAHRENLGRLMIANRGRIDELALLIQEWNTVRSRLKTPALSRSGATMQALERLQTPLNAIWGEFDAPANPQAPKRAAALRQLRPDADVRMIDGAGHWVAYETPATVNAMLLDMLARS